MSWRLAYSLETLRDQVNAAYPGRSTASDGTIGDAAHAAVASDHNPNPPGVVCAFDITHDPASGCDTYALADRLLANRHPDLKYLISNRRIAGAWTNWQWTPYSGTADPHTNHVHVSVGVGNDGQSVQPYDDRVKWNVEGGNQDMLSTDSKFKIYRMGLLNDPNPDEAAGFDKMDDNTTVDNAWNNGGKDYKQKAEAIRINDIRAAKLKQLGNIVGKDPDKDGIDAIIAAVIALASKPTNADAQKKLDQIKQIIG
jgi:hypothetical protein